MFAVIRTGGKQYRVGASDLVEIERLVGDAGDAVAFGEVLMVGGDEGVTIGSPLVAGASVAAEIVEQHRSGKVLVFKKRRRKNSKVSRNHRQQHTLVRITEILTDGKAPAKATAKAAPKAKAKAAPKAEPAKPTEPKAVPAADKRDDLKKIGGIGPAIAKKLNDAGITTLAEIAAWTADDIARVDAELNFRGRIEREDWVGQAKKLAAGEE